MAQYNVNNIMVSSLLSSIRDGTIAILKYRDLLFGTLQRFVI